ncbi:MAG: pyridoxal-phosphate dependent enzyme [Pseudomonadota bacterium]|jgi:threonine dehydratase
MGEFALVVDDIVAARGRLAPFLPVTPLYEAGGLSAEFGRSILCKWDNQLRSGAFKERGALNFLLNLGADALARGVCAASAGNHALALSMHAARLKAPCHLVMPVAAPLVKVERCRRLGALITQIGTLNECLGYASELAKREGLAYVHPYDDALIVAGQGVAGLEALDQCADFDSVVIPVGGGGYAAGVAMAIKASRPDVFILGVCSEWAERMRAKPPGDGVVPMTIADGIAVKTLGKITKPILDSLVDRVVAVSEEAIARAVVLVLEQEHAVVEGAAAAGVAALLEGLLPERCKRPLLFMCGSNIDTNILSRLIEHSMAERGRLLRVRITLPDRPGMLHQISGVIARGGANVLQVMHDRSYAKAPGHVDITVMMEVRDREHAKQVVAELEANGLPTEIV